jgi:hypothetical protein
MSTFAFYRPKGIPGAYVVGIELILLPTESAHILLRPSYRNHVQQQLPVQERGSDDGNHIQWYCVEQLVIGDSIHIQINDRRLLPYQLTTYSANSIGFRQEDIPYSMVNNLLTTIHYGVVNLRSR